VGVGAVAFKEGNAPFRLLLDTHWLSSELNPHCAGRLGIYPGKVIELSEMEVCGNRLKDLMDHVRWLVDQDKPFNLLKIADHPSARAIQFCSTIGLGLDAIPERVLFDKEAVRQIAVLFARHPRQLFLWELIGCETGALGLEMFEKDERESLTEDQRVGAFRDACEQTNASEKVRLAPNTCLHVTTLGRAPLSACGIQLCPKGQVSLGSQVSRGEARALMLEPNLPLLNLPGAMPTSISSQMLPGPGFPRELRAAQFYLQPGSFPLACCDEYASFGPAAALSLFGGGVPTAAQQVSLIHSGAALRSVLGVEEAPPRLFDRRTFLALVGRHAAAATDIRGFCGSTETGAAWDKRLYASRDTASIPETRAAIAKVRLDGDMRVMQTLEWLTERLDSDAAVALGIRQVVTRYGAPTVD
jgi:hypothetical protein